MRRCARTCRSRYFIPGRGAAASSFWSASIPVTRSRKSGSHPSPAKVRVMSEP